jgi:hypothetical protein
MQRQSRRPTARVGKGLIYDSDSVRFLPGENMGNFQTRIHMQRYFIRNHSQMIAACGYNCHAKCEMKVPPYCSQIAGSPRSIQSPATISVGSASSKRHTAFITSTTSSTMSTPLATISSAARSFSSPTLNQLGTFL